MVLGATSPIFLPVCAFAKENLAKLVERTRKSGVDGWLAAATTKSITLSVGSCARITRPRMHSHDDHSLNEVEAE